MKAINLKALIDAHGSLPQDTFEKYLSLYGITLARQGKNDGVKEEELDCLKAFANHFAKEQCRTRLLDNFFIGYKIPQIGKEFDLLVYFLQNQNVILPKSQIFDRLWGFDSDTTVSVVEVYVSKIRKKLKGTDFAANLQTLRSVGYILKHAD